MSKKKRTDREEELLIVGINARIQELRKMIEVDASSGRPHEQFLKNLSTAFEELQELIKMKEDLT